MFSVPLDLSITMIDGLSPQSVHIIASAIRKEDKGRISLSGPSSGLDRTKS